RWLLPLLVPRELPLGRGLAPVHGLLISGGGALSGTWRWTLILIPAALAAVHFSDTPVRDLDVDSLSPIGEERRAEDRDLRADLGFWYGGKLAVVVGDSAQAALERSEALAEELDTLIEEGVITRYDMAATFLPSRARQERQLAAIPREGELRERLAAALEGSPFRKDVFEPFIEEAVAARQREPLSVESLAHTQMGERIEALLFQEDGLWIAPVLLHGVSDEARLDALNRRYGDSEVLYLNIKERAEDILATAVDHALPLLGFGVLAIYLLLAVSYRSVTRPFRVL